jgi:phosphate-selective porin OprO/OprP
MRQILLCALVSALGAPFGFGQQPQGAGSALQGSVARVTIVGVAPAPPADDIKELKEAITQLQERLNRLAPADGQTRKDAASTSTSESSSADTSTEKSSSPKSEAKTPKTEESEGSWSLTASWKKGLELKNKEDDFRVHVGGRMQFDAGWNVASDAVQFGPGGIGELQDGAVFRRATLRVDGTLYKHFEWAAEFDFASSTENDNAPTNQAVGTPSFTELWFGANDVPLVGTVRVGWQKEPIGFEHLTSSRWLNFMERAPGSGSLQLDSPGILLRNTSEDERVTWAFGFFHVTNNNFGFGIGDGEYAETGRLTCLAWYEDDGCELLHLGIAATNRGLPNNVVRLRARPSVRTMPGSLEPSLADTGTISASTQEGMDLELAGVYGPWTLQSEYFITWLHEAVFPNQPPPQGVDRGTLFYQGAYVELLYFLTGEHRAYNRKTAVFDRVVPLRNFNIWDGEWGLGAWQVRVRYGYLELQNKGVNGATLNDVVLGLNWFLNPNTKVQWNLAIDHRSSTPAGSSGWTYIGGMRLAFDF